MACPLLHKGGHNECINYSSLQAVGILLILILGDC